MIQPATTWTALRRPMLVAVVFGCSFSLMDASRLTLRLALPAAIWWTFIPILEAAALFCASARARSVRPWQRTVDQFFETHRPWLLWVAAFSAYWAFLPIATAFSWPERYRAWFWSAAAVTVWSAWLDYRFFRRALGLPRWPACRDLLLQRVISWTIGLAIFVGPAGYQTIASRLGL